jgi:copper transport protein
VGFAIPDTERGSKAPLSRLVLFMAVALLASLAVVVDAFAHAELLGSKPRPGQVLERSPRAVVLTFDEAIDAEFVQLRVEDRAGRKIDRGEPYHPRGREELLAVRLAANLDGAYFARYRVISEDGHPVTKTTRFRVRPPEPPKEEEKKTERMAPGGAGGAGGGPAMPEREPEHEAAGGQVTSTAFGVARGLGYLAMALAIGGVAFGLVAWLPALAAHAGGGSDWRAAATGFVRRLKLVVLGAVLLGLVATTLAIVLEAATALGVSFWSALDRNAIDAVSGTRVVEAWTARLGIWLVLGVLFVLALRPKRAPVLRRAALGAEGAVLAPTPSRPQILIVFAAVVALALTAPLAGHAGSTSPTALLVTTDTLHVLSMSVWLGGLVLLLYALFGAARKLPPTERTPLLADAVGRFSRLATVAVLVLLLTGIVQSIFLVESIDALFETAYGRLVLVKIVLFVGLMALGAYNQRRSLPRLRRLADGAEEPGRAGALLRRTVAFEVGFALIVLGFTSALVVTMPPGG